MEIAQLRAFVAVADAAHYARAAERLHISQPALSKRIQALETSIGAPLFLRDRRGVALTVIGAQLLEEARRLVQSAEALKLRSRRLAKGEAGRLDIGFGLSSIDLAPRMIAAFRRAYPDVTVILNDLPAAIQEERLAERGLDLAFVRLPLARDVLQSRIVGADRLALAVPGSFVFSGERPDFAALNKTGFIALAQLRGAGLHAQIERWREANGVHLRIVQIADDIQTILALVAAEAGYAIVPMQAARLMSNAISLVPLDGQGADWEVGIAWHPENVNPAVRSFLDLHKLGD